MEILSINPATGERLASFEETPDAEVERALEQAREAFRRWRQVPFAERAAHMRAAAAYLRQHKADLARLITSEMGKPIVQAEAEVEKCAWACDYYADNAEAFLADIPKEGSGRAAYVAFRPLGPVFAIMPWNFPFWQVFRFAAPALMAGNVGLLKHASNVPQCSLAIERVFREAGFPDGVFRSLLISGRKASELIADPRVAAVTLTGSEVAGRQVAAAAGQALKKTVLELGGSDPFIVLEDADLDAAARTGAWARNQNTGQSCIAAKRFIVVEAVADAFEEKFCEAVAELRVGDPMDRETQVGPLAREDLVAALDRQVRASVEAGARVAVGGERMPGPGFFYRPTVLLNVDREMAVACEETFGPAAAVIRVRDETEAIDVANATSYGLGASVWTADEARGRRLAAQIESGSVFINGMVASDPRLPFGGVKNSGYGRELSEFGIREFVNVQTVWVGPAK
ncbi:MAG: NAD-dependent succinate-semialdehyde dehydrogenase [Clostridia bacterium]|nr:NAD-dependent succinate-semialdehyde dehydrogenase [Clostridia bacterium]